MKKILLRILAFILDLALATFIIYGINSLSFINPNISELNRYYKAYYKESVVFDNIYGTQNKKGDIDTYFEDKIITDEELNDVRSLYNSYVSCFDDIKLNEDITNEEIQRVKENILTQNTKIKNDMGVTINKLKYQETIISLIVFIAYFGILEYLLDGQTPFKRLFRIKTVKVTKNKKISLLSTIVRALLKSEIIISLVEVILLFSLKQDNYITASYWLSQFKYIYEMSFLLCMIVRDDSRSIHDLILNTRVLRYDKQGKEIVEQLFNDADAESIIKSN